MENTATNNNNENTQAASQTKPLPVVITISMPTQTYFVSGIRDFTLNLIKNMTSFSEQWAFRFQSIVDELCNNAIEHGSRTGETIKIIFESQSQEYIQITVEDSGTAAKHLKAAEITKLVNERKSQTVLNGLIRGRGLPKIVAEWTDEMEFSDLANGGIKARVRKYLKDPALQETSPSSLESPSHIVLN